MIIDYNKFYTLTSSLKLKKEKYEIDFLLDVSDQLFMFFRDFIALNIIDLNAVRKVLRSSEIEKKKMGQTTFETIRGNWIQVSNDFCSINEYYLNDKSLRSLSELLLTTFERKVKSKIPQLPINYLEKESIDASDIDWIYNRLKENSSKYFQSYSVSRINYLIRE